MLCWFLPYNNLNKPCKHTYTPSLFKLPPTPSVFFYHWIIFYYMDIKCWKILGTGKRLAMILLVRTGRKRGRNGCEASGCPLPIFLNVFAVGGGVAIDRGEVKCFLFLRLLLTLFTMIDEEYIWTYHKIFETATVEKNPFFLLPFSRKKSFFSSTFLFVTASASLSPCFYFSHIYMSFLKISLLTLSFLKSLSLFYSLPFSFPFSFGNMTYLI